MKRLLTGLQSSGTLHIGNYFGAIKPFLDTYQQYQSFLMVADYHALTSLKDPVALRDSIHNGVLDYLTLGLDPNRCVLFQQSQVSEHTELAWIFECLVTVPFLSLSHAYKDKLAKGLEANAGLFNYPMLMAADILLYDAEVVPVGEDQRQHVEYAREAAHKFNTTYTDIFTEPQALINAYVGVVPGTDGKKMSKSYGNTIPLFATRDEIVTTVMSIVTDSTGDVPVNVHAIHKLFKSEAELAPLYDTNKGKYKNLKDALIEDIDAFMAPLRDKRIALASDPDTVTRVLSSGSDVARSYAQTKMIAVRAAVGIR